MNDEPTTIQLRRYQFPDGDLAPFVPWWQEYVPTLREKFGFAVEWAYSLPETQEFVWAVSFQGTREQFLEAELIYMESRERAETFATVPVPAPEYNNRFVDSLYD